MLRVSQSFAMKTSLAGSIKTYRYSSVIHFSLISAQRKVWFFRLGYFHGKHNASETALIRNTSAGFHYLIISIMKMKLLNRNECAGCKKGSMPLTCLLPSWTFLWPTVWCAVGFVGVPESSGLRLTADSQKLYCQLSQDISVHSSQKRSKSVWYECILVSKIIKMNPVTLSFFHFISFFLMFFNENGLLLWRRQCHAFLCRGQQSRLLCSLSLRETFQSLKQTALPGAGWLLSLWPQGGDTVASELPLSWSSQRGSSSKLLAAFSDVNNQDKSSPCFFFPGKVAATRVTFNSLTWQIDRKGRLRIKERK